MLRNARYYAPQWGQFLTRDPFPGLLSHPATQAPYPYALNNPLRYTDPSGEFVETLFDLAMVGYSVYTIGDKLQRGCAVPWTDWAALGLDALSLVLPFVPAGGMVIRLAAHADDLGDAARLIHKSDNIFRIGKQLPLPGMEQYVKDVPSQLHHLITNKGKYWPEIMRKMTDKYKLDLDDDWNKVALPGHSGSHTNWYHQWVHKRLQEIDAIAKGDKDLFLDLFTEFVKKPVLDNPRLPYQK
ncbi:MAG: AHH domain-containing protein [Bellilinea sp.]